MSALKNVPMTPRIVLTIVCSKARKPVKTLAMALKMEAKRLPMLSIREGILAICFCGWFGSVWEVAS